MEDPLELIVLYRGPNALGSYLAGLFEGDGHIWIPQTERAPSGKLYTPHFCITFVLKDLPLANKLKEILGTGYIRMKDADNACVLMITNIDGLFKVVDLINGKLRSPKIHQFTKLVDWLNNKTGRDTAVLPLDTTPLDSNGWLAGFIDTDGGFKIRITEPSINPETGQLTKARIACHFRIEQRRFYP